MNMLREIGPDPLRPVELEEITDKEEDYRRTIEKENRMLQKYTNEPMAFIEDLQLTTAEDFDKSNVSNVYNLILMFEQTLSANIRPVSLKSDQRSEIREALEECFAQWTAEFKKEAITERFDINYGLLMEIVKIISRIRIENSNWKPFEIEKSSIFVEMERTVKNLQAMYLSRVSATAKEFKRERKDKKFLKIKENVKKFILNNPTTYFKLKFYNDFKYTLTEEELTKAIKESQIKSNGPKEVEVKKFEA